MPSISRWRILIIPLAVYIGALVILILDWPPVLPEIVGGASALLFLAASLLPAVAFACLFPKSVRTLSLRGFGLIVLGGWISTMFGMIPFSILLARDTPNDYSFLAFYSLQLTTPLWYGVFTFAFLLALWMDRIVFPSIHTKGAES